MFNIVIAIVCGLEFAIPSLLLRIFITLKPANFPFLILQNVLRLTKTLNFKRLLLTFSFLKDFLLLPPYKTLIFLKQKK